ncbi:MAG: Crp/Fnr family transcriptional regulator [Acidimicrobiia bacterium]
MAHQHSAKRELLYCGEPKGGFLRADRVAEVLSESQLFGNLAGDELAALAAGCISRRFSKGDFVFHEGDRGESLYVVAEGLIKVFVTSEDGSEVILATLEPPQTFGEMAIIDGGPRTASAKAIQPSLLLALTRETFVESLKKHPGLVEALHASLGKLLRRLLEQTADLVFLDLHGRVAKLLLRLADEKGSREGEEIRLDLKLSQGELAAMVGGSRPSVNQALRALEGRAYIEVDGRSILIRRPDLLRRRASL